ncbi:MAG: hypothetical protein GXO70_05490 [Acidobacteria bacterium]|nr:hypothetical protein [Acidobacteriota bacterium]
MRNILLCLLAIVCFQGIAADRILKYNPDTVRSFSGKILKVEEQYWYGKKPNLLFVIAPDGNIPALLVDGGLASLYKKKPKAGSRVRVTGSFVKTGKQEIVLSRLITINGRIISIRMENGVPTWLSRKNKGGGGRDRHSFFYRRMRHGRR